LHCEKIVLKKGIKDEQPSIFIRAQDAPAFGKGIYTLNDKYETYFALTFDKFVDSILIPNERQGIEKGPPQSHKLGVNKNVLFGRNF